MIVVYSILVLLGMWVIWLIYDKISWYVAKFEEARHGTIVIAEHMKFLRECLVNSNTPDKKELEGIFREIQLNNARSAYILGGIKLLDKVSKVQPTVLSGTVVTNITTASAADVLLDKQAYETSSTVKGKTKSRKKQIVK